MIALGIDPGTRVSGFVIFKKEHRQVHVLDFGIINLPAHRELTDRVGDFFTFFKGKIEQFGVTDIALETPFLGKSALNYLKLGYLRGAVYILTSHYKLSLHEYSPRQVKQAVTGYGGADKEQVARMILKLFPGLAMPKKFDLTDAFGVGMCCVWASAQPIFHK